MVTAHAVAHALLVSTPYTERIMFHAFRGRTVTAASRMLPPVVLVAGALAFLLSRRFRDPGWPAGWRLWCSSRFLVARPIASGRR